MTQILRWLPLLALLAACEPKIRLLPDANRTPEPIRAACALAERSCSACHDLERVLVARSPDWNATVDRMRRLPRSGISEQDGKVIVTCLEYISPPAGGLPAPSAPSAPPAPPAPSAPSAWTPADHSNARNASSAALSSAVSRTSVASLGAPSW